MPELPDVVNYCRALERLVVGQRLEKIQLASPFLLRTVEPALLAFHRKRLDSVSREAKLPYYYVCVVILTPRAGSFSEKGMLSEGQGTSSRHLR